MNGPCSKMPTEERLRLFTAVCSAIQHAHQKGIIHRDIKPNNILVTLDCGKPTPKVIDFGIAKATNQELTEKTLFTNYAQMIGTPAYMSPEQAEMSSLDVDSRTDIYSLGVLLYELLTGSTPILEKDLLSQGYGEIARILQHKEPEKPSTRLSTMGGALRAVAEKRSCEPQSLSRLVSGDLDWIVLKAIEKDRRRRYGTPNELLSDVECCLANEPVSACPPSRVYRLKKLLHRNKTMAAAGGIVTLAVLLGLSVATMGLIRATREERVASAVTEFLQRDLLAQADVTEAEAFQSPDRD